MSASAGVNLKFRWGLTPTNAEQQPVLIVGQASHLSAIKWSDINIKLQPYITEQAWSRAISCVTSSPGETCELWPRAISVSSLPSRCSRHAAPSRSHALAKIIARAQRYTDEYIVLVCRKRDVYACAVAIARSLPLYSARSGSAPLATGTQATQNGNKSVTVEIQLVKESGQEANVDAYLKDGSLSDEDLATIQQAADAVRLAARITDTPCNYMNVEKFITEAHAVAESLDIAPPTVILGEELKSRGMGGIYGVGKAAESPPALVSLTYRPSNCDGPGLALVGKGIVYDTGGLSIKARTSMVGMKGDCGGAAAVLGAFMCAVKAKPNTAVHAVLCLAENAVGPKSTRPDDIHHLYSGRTVEINNTDAEGRLVLSDGVVYAQRDLKADIIVDVATLTGAQGIATGKYHAAILSNNALLERRCVAAGLASGDLAHPMPFAPELHFTEFSSVVADMKNSVADRDNAQPSCAGLFILSHLGFEFPGQWLHVDMAAPSHSGERATGYGVALLSVLFGNLTQNKLLKSLSPYEDI